MTISPITTCSRRAVYVGGNIGNKMLGSICTVSQSPSNLCCSFFHYGQSQRRCSAVTICSSIGSQFEGRFLVSGFSKPRRNSPPLMMRNSVSSTGDQTARLGLSSRGRNMSLRLSVPSQEKVSQISWSMKPANRRKGSASTGLIVGLFVCFAYSEPVKAEIAKRTKTMDDDVDEDEDDSSSASTSHGKKVYTNYSVTGEECHLYNILFVVIMVLYCSLFMLMSCVFLFWFVKNNLLLHVPYLKSLKLLYMYL